MFFKCSYVYGYNPFISNPQTNSFHISPVSTCIQPIIDRFPFCNDNIDNTFQFVSIFLVESSTLHECSGYVVHVMQSRLGLPKVL